MDKKSGIDMSIFELADRLDLRNLPKFEEIVIPEKEPVGTEKFNEKAVADKSLPQPITY